MALAFRVDPFCSPSILTFLAVDRDAAGAFLGVASAADLGVAFRFLLEDTPADVFCALAFFLVVFDLGGVRLPWDPDLVVRLPSWDLVVGLLLGFVFAMVTNKKGENSTGVLSDVGP